MAPTAIAVVCAVVCAFAGVLFEVRSDLGLTIWVRSDLGTKRLAWVQSDLGLIIWVRCDLGTKRLDCVQSDLGLTIWAFRYEVPNPQSQKVIVKNLILTLIQSPSLPFYHY